MCLFDSVCYGLAQPGTLNSVYRTIPYHTVPYRTVPYHTIPSPGCVVKKCHKGFVVVVSRFGAGYTVTVRLSGDRPDALPLQQFMTDTFSNAELREHHQNVLHYQLPTVDVTLAQIFSHMERTRTLFSVEDYAVSQTTLDQVPFASFT